MTDTLTARIPDHALDALTWRCLGPWRGGRVMATCGHPTRPETYFFGASGGGVWRTDNGGATWRPLSDSTNGTNGAFRRGSIGAVAVAPSEPDTLYVGTGECGLRSNVTGGDGLYGSRDGGETWRHRGLTETQNIARVVVHPRDALTVYVAAFGHRFGPNAGRGVYRTRDGGESWERVLFRDERSGAIDLAIDPQNPRTLYAALWEAQRTPWGFTSGGPGSGLFRSTDGGDTWDEITRNPGLPTGIIGRVGLSVSPADPRRIYALIEAESGGRRVSGVYRSLDRGRTWAWTSDEPNLAVRPWYFGQIVADPIDADTVYVPHRKLWKSVDGGRTFRQLNTTYWDQHALWVAPDDPRRMIVGNDGGAAVSRDGGTTWSSNLNQPTAEMYRVTTDDRFPYRVYSAQQDNSTISIPHRSFTGPPSQMHWYDVVGGESGHIAVRPDNPDIVYAASFAGEVTRYDHATGDQHTISVWPEPSDGWGAESVRHRFNWSTPVALSPHDPGVLYVCGERVFRSTDEGQTYEPISPDLSRNDRTKMGRAGGPVTYDSAGTDYYGTIMAFAESPLQQGILWAGTDDGLLHVSHDNGATWANVTPPGLPAWANVNTIEVSPWDVGGAYVAASNQKQDDLRPLLYRTTDYGATWTAITTGIPDDEFCRTIRCDPARRGLLYAGSEGGVWLSLDDGAAWRPFAQNMPAVTVYDLQVKNGDLIAATHGRGLWILDDLTPLHILAAETLDAPAHLFPPRPTTRVTRAVFGISSLIALAYPHAADNPPAGVMLHFWLRNTLPKGDLTLTIRNPNGELIEEYRSRVQRSGVRLLGPLRSRLRGSTAVQERRGPGEEDGSVRVGVLPPEMQEAPHDFGRLTTRPGLNRFVWDMLYPGAAELPGYNGAGLTTPIALPGTYIADLEIGDETYTTTFEIVRDPRMKATEADLRAQFDLIVKVRDSVTLAHETIKIIKPLQLRLYSAYGLLIDSFFSTTIFDEAELLYYNCDAALSWIQDALHNPALHDHAGEQEDLNSPYGLSEKMGKFGYWVAKADVTPTRQMYQVYAHLAAGIREQVARLHEIVRTDLAALNAQLAAAGLPTVIPPDLPALPADGAERDAPGV